jgi:signal transduction histidine kinase
MPIFRRLKVYNRGFIRGLQTQLLVLVIIPTAIVLIVIAFGLAFLHERAMRHLVGERDARAAQTAAESLNERLRLREMALTLLASQVGSSSYNTVVGDVESLFDYGLLLTDSPDSELESWLPAGTWQWYYASTYLPVLVGHSEEQTWVVFGVPAGGSRYLYGATSLEGLGIPALLASLQSNPETHVYLVNQDGHTLYGHALAAEDTHIGQPASHYRGVAAVMRGETGYLQDASLMGEDMVVGYSPVPRLGWGLMVEDPWHAGSSPLLRFSYAIQIFLLIVMLMGVLVVSFSILRIVRPLQRLKARAAALMNGDFEAIREPVGGVREIEELRQALTQMAKAVQESQAQLHQYVKSITLGQEEERAHLARDLHDDTIQALIALGQQVQIAQRTLERDPVAASQRLQEVRLLAEQSIHDVRRMIRGLRPTYLTELGLVAALEMLLEQEENLPMTCEVRGEIRRLPADTELALYRIAQEASTNIRKHSQATQATLQLTYDSDSLELQISDNGQGFEVPPLQRLPVSGHYGLLGMQERAQLINAALNISSAPGRGTTVHVTLPAEPPY